MAKKKSITDLVKMKENGEIVSWMVLYDSPFASYAEAAGMDMILVGDSMGMIVYGYDDTIPVTMDMEISHCQAVRRGAPNTYIVGDMPFGSYQASVEDAVNNAVRFYKEGNVDAIKLEGGVAVAPQIKAIAQSGMVVIGHIGLTPQSSAAMGGFKAQGRTTDSARAVIEDAIAVYEAGARILLIEGVPEETAKFIHDLLPIPVYGIGAGAGLETRDLVYLSQQQQRRRRKRERYTRSRVDVAGLVESKKTTDIVDISNQSSKEGIRIVLELKKGADVENLKNMLYKKTRLEDTFGVNMLAVADGRPETLSLKQIIEHHVDFQFELATRKYTTLLEKEQEKSEVQEGLIKACDVIDLIIEILRGSKSVKDAKACLINGVTDNITFKSPRSKKMAALLRFTERQATAILEMRLYRLIGLEIEALIREHEETLKNIARYEDILNNYDSMAGVIIEDLDRFKKEYGRKRRTSIENAAEAVFEEKKIEEQEVVFLMDRFGYAKTVDVSVYERNKEAADSESRYVVHCMNTGKLCIFTDAGRMHQVRVLDLPYGRFREKGTPIDNVSNYSSSEEQIIAVYDAEQMRFAKLLFATAQGMIKRVDGTEFQVSKRTIAATKLQEGDSLTAVKVVNDSQNVVLQTKNGYFLRFHASEVPEKKKAAVGVRGIRLQKKDELENAYLFEEGTETKVPYGEKEVTLNRLKLAKRDGMGTKTR